MTDTIRILVATDNHVGAHERDPIRSDDSWKTFHEIMCLANEKEVDMVLLAGDLFHENKPSRKSMYNVMRSLRMNCLGARPCELEMLSDGSEHFDAAFDHVNYEDPDINVSIPVFSIHGNHDDPSGDGHFAALDLLAMSGLMNYYGKTPQSDNIHVRPVLLQKGRTKLALYGLSNVRDERLYRTFRDQKVKFYQPGTQQGDWFQMICVHQNHHAHTETSYLPENFLPEFLDLVIWGHEHECDIEPHLNPEMNFRVMQPGSSVATSLIPGEAVPKHIALVSITGKEFKTEAIRLKTVRPFVYKDVVLAQDKEAVRIAKKEEHRTDLTRYLIRVVEGMIEEAKQEWQEAQTEVQDEDEEPPQCPLPLIRLRVEVTSPDGLGKFDVENAQRFSNRFIEKVANTNDVIQIHSRKKATTTKTSKATEGEKEIMARTKALDELDVHNLVHEFLDAQSLVILPQNYFADAVTQYVQKDDKHAMEMFVNESLANQIQSLVRMQGEDNDSEEEETLATQIQEVRAKLEQDFAKGNLKIKRSKAHYKPKPATWDSDIDGAWEDEPAALIRSDEERDDDEDDDDGATPAPRTTARGRGARGRGGRGAAAASTRGKTTTARRPAASTTSRSRKNIIDEDDDDEDEDIVMLDDDDDDDSQAMFFNDNKKKANGTPSTTRGRKSASSTAATRGSTTRATPTTRKPPARAAASTAKPKQGTLSFSASQQSVLGNGRAGTAARRGRDVSEDIEDDDDDDAFEPLSKTRARR